MKTLELMELNTQLRRLTSERAEATNKRELKRLDNSIAVTQRDIQSLVTNSRNPMYQLKSALAS
ncbi:hypothetical protein LCGC14_0145140 [marine sediment metagenome]|uniref:Uncharacterized protein n=1 Tax=marine sediment metagenome TaxID=412755 RepID=A0A0F9VF69_9ZZZZ